MGEKLQAEIRALESRISITKATDRTTLEQKIAKTTKPTKVTKATKVTKGAKATTGGKTKATGVENKEDTENVVEAIGKSDKKTTESKQPIPIFQPPSRYT